MEKRNAGDELKGKEMKRLCIYVTYDEEQTADTYIGYMLRELKKVADTLIVVCNYQSVVKGAENILPFADNILYRENTGYDAGAFRSALCDFIGWESIEEFDELILANDSFYGPFKAMEEIFEEMDRPGYDFWGLTEHARTKSGNHIIPEHIQSFFLVVCGRMLHSIHFRNYWEQMPCFNSYQEVVSKHEMLFTRYFGSMGYQYGCLADMLPNESVNIENNYNQYCHLQYELISKRNFPFLKKRPVTFDVLEMQTQENFRQALEYIGKNTIYNVDMIWENLIRTVNIADLQRNFHLDYIIQQQKDLNKKSGVRILVFARYRQAESYVCEYLERLHGCFEIQVWSGSPDVVSDYQEKGYQVFSLDDNRMIRKMLDGKISYICILYDTDVSGRDEPGCTAKSLFYNSWHNLLAGPEYVYSLLDCFEQEERLGALTAPYPVFSEYFGKPVLEWNRYYKDIRSILKENNINCRISKDKQPLAASGSLWIRAVLLSEIPEHLLSECLLSDKTYMFFLWPCIVQGMGCYTGTAESVDYASLKETNLQYYMNQLIGQVNRIYGGGLTFKDMQTGISGAVLKEFCGRYDRIYIYGTGSIAEQYQHLIPKTEAYIVSDGYSKEESRRDKKMIYVSELPYGDDIGVVICMNAENQSQVIPLLEEKGISFLCV